MYLQVPRRQFYCPTCQRYGIEAMCKDCKTGGYNLEDSQASQDKLVRLVLLIVIAMTAAWLQGEKTSIWHPLGCWAWSGCQQELTGLKQILSPNKA